jgi:hypothetical protein
MTEYRDCSRIFPLTVAEICRLMTQIHQHENGCWLWTGFTGEKDYGHVTLRGSKWLVHRIMYRLYKGPIPKGYVIDHKCHNRHCCNPEHLEAVTLKVNGERKRPWKHTRRSRPTHCKKGHPLIGDNVRMVMVDGKPHQVCVQCDRERKRRYKEKKKAMQATQVVAATVPHPAFVTVSPVAQASDAS